MAEQFKTFAVAECRGISPLYETLSLHLAEDEELLRIAASARAGQPIPNLMFGAVHALLMQGAVHELREYYPSLTPIARPEALAFPCFRDFCRRHAQELVALLESRRVQTNEVGRCAYLYPAFCEIYAIASRPLTLVEIGTSAGLQLLWDRYAYRYNGVDAYGSPASLVRLDSEIRGKRQPSLRKLSPPVAARIGIDLHVNDLGREEDALWLKALIWPEHHDRRTRLDSAAKLVHACRPDLVEGDALALLAGLVSAMPKEAAVCVFHTHVANQFSYVEKNQLMAQLDQIGMSRDIFHLYNNMQDPLLHLDYWQKGRRQRSLVLAETDGHGRWFRWLLGSS
ncbi:DUF2332 domain-containing protein [Paenibacillus methanolicus]|uniref:DUF2332 domain-containing protein n=1 Tax=Paenibacillus methanolicus TaxID=582686 RepID=UPI0011E789F6|nr:DUF2332 domain-containing protein [Paenibacillus methanolicus]